MGKHVFLALSRPSEGREQDFHAWYDAYHLADVVNHCPGFVSGQRYFADNPAQAAEGQPSLAIYLLDSDDLEALHRSAADSVDLFTPSNGVFAPDHSAWVYSAQSGHESDLEHWERREDRSEVTLLFFENAADASAAAELAEKDASPLLVRAKNQRNGEWPAWPYLVLIHGAPEISAVGKAAKAWAYQPRGVRVTTALQ